MSTVCPTCYSPQRPGRRCRSCAGIDAPTPTPARVAPEVGAPAPVVLAETRYRELRDRGDWPTGWPLPVYPGTLHAPATDRRPPNE